MIMILRSSSLKLRLWWCIFMVLVSSFWWIFSQHLHRRLFFVGGFVSQNLHRRLIVWWILSQNYHSRLVIFQKSSIPKNSNREAQNQETWKNRVWFFPGEKSNYVLQILGFSTSRYREQKMRKFWNKSDSGKKILE